MKRGPGAALPGLLAPFVVNNEQAGKALGLTQGAVAMLLALGAMGFLTIAVLHEVQHGARLRSLAGWLAFAVAGAVLPFAAAILTLLAWMKLVGLKYQVLASVLALLAALVTGFLLISWCKRRSPEVHHRY